jgi:hypothetical protein
MTEILIDLLDEALKVGTLSVRADSSRGLGTAGSSWKAHLLEEGGIARITLEPLQVGLAFYL